MTVAVSSHRYQSRRSDEGLRLRLVELAREKPRFGYRRLHVFLRRSGEGGGPALASEEVLRVPHLSRHATGGAFELSPFIGNCTIWAPMIRAGGGHR